MDDELNAVRQHARTLEEVCKCVCSCTPTHACTQARHARAANMHVRHAARHARTAHMRTRTHIHLLTHTHTYTHAAHTYTHMQAAEERARNSKATADLEQARTSTSALMALWRYSLRAPYDLQPATPHCSRPSRPPVLWHGMVALWHTADGAVSCGFPDEAQPRLAKCPGQSEAAVEHPDNKTAWAGGRPSG